MPDCSPSPDSLFPRCSGLRAQYLDVETHDHLLAVLIDAVSRLAGGLEALKAALSDVESTASLLTAPGETDATLLMTSEFVDAWRVGKD